MVKATKVRTLEDIAKDAKAVATHYEKGWALKEELNVIQSRVNEVGDILADAGIE